jgi:hypothetical protein
MRTVLGASAALALLFTILVWPVMATTEHCPTGGTKYENGAFNSIVLHAGTQFCVKGSVDATGILVADGQKTLVDYLGSGHDVSYYVVYEGVTPSATPPITPSPSPSQSPTPSVTPVPSATPPASSPPSPEPSVSPSPVPTSTPTPSVTPSPTSTPTPGPSTPIPTPPATDTE